MRVHSILHRKPDIRLNFEDQLSSLGMAYNSSSFMHGDVPPNAEEMDALIVFGGSMSAYDEAHNPWLIDELSWIEKVMRSGKPVLGICLGGQLLSRILGARVYKNPEGLELGFYPISLTEEGRRSPLFSGYPESFTAFEWHNDIFDLPVGARHLAKGDYWKNQAWAYGDSTFALQFHLEFSHSNVKKFFESDADALAKPSRSVQAPEAILSDAKGFADVQESFHKMLLNFKSLVWDLEEKMNHE